MYKLIVTAITFLLKAISYEPEPKSLNTEITMHPECTLLTIHLSPGGQLIDHAGKSVDQGQFYYIAFSDNFLKIY